MVKSNQFKSIWTEILNLVIKNKLNGSYLKKKTMVYGYGLIYKPIKLKSEQLKYINILICNFIIKYIIYT